MPSAGWIAGLLIAGFLLGWGAWAFAAWWRREEEKDDASFHRIFGGALTHLVAGRTAEAIDDLTRAARIRTDVVAVYLILGDLHRDRGQFDRAIRIHASLLGRADLSRAERAQSLTSLGEDYRAAGLADRARESFRQALELDPKSLPALKGLVKFEIEERRWAQAAEYEERILRLEPTRPGRNLGWLHYEMGLDALRADDEKGAARSFLRAIAVDETIYPAHLHLGDLQYKEGRRGKARASWEKILELSPRLLHVVYDRLEQAYAEDGENDRLDMICHRLAEKDPSDWRVRVLLARGENDRGNPEAASRLLLDAAKAFPGSVTVQRELWSMALQRGLDKRVAREVAGSAPSQDLFADAFFCGTCRFRSRAYVWRCPRCHQWDTMTDRAPEPKAIEGSAPSESQHPGVSDA